MEVVGLAFVTAVAALLWNYYGDLVALSRKSDKTIQKKRFSLIIPEGGTCLAAP